MPYLLEKSRFGTNFFYKRYTILLLYMYQVFIFPQDHLRFFLHFFFTFMEQFFLDDPIAGQMNVWFYLFLPSNRYKDFTWQISMPWFSQDKTRRITIPLEFISDFFSFAESARCESVKERKFFLLFPFFTRSKISTFFAIDR